MTVFLWVGFVILVLLLLALDLGVFNRNPHVVSTREALGWTVFWVALALAFNALVYVMYEEHWLGIGEAVGHPISGREAALDFFTAYLVEKSLSLDNIFVIAMIFAYFQVPPRYQHRVLFWGVLGALVMRGTMIGAGIAMIQQFSWMVYVLGALLLFTAVKMMLTRQETLEPQKSPLMRLVRRFFPITHEFHDDHLFVRQAGRWAATPLFLALVIVESTDLLFAVDSIPAVFAVTLDPFIVFTSNVFAILGLRSLYFALAAMMDRFRYIKMSLVFILAFVGVKMILTHHYRIESVVSLSVIVGTLLVGIMSSAIGGHDDPARLSSPLDEGSRDSGPVSARTVRVVFALLASSTVLLTLAGLVLAPGYPAVIILVGVFALISAFMWARVWVARHRDRD